MNTARAFAVVVILVAHGCGAIVLSDWDQQRTTTWLLSRLVSANCHVDGWSLIASHPIALGLLGNLTKALDGWTKDETALWLRNVCGDGESQGTGTAVGTEFRDAFRAERETLKVQGRADVYHRQAERFAESGKLFEAERLEALALKMDPTNSTIRLALEIWLDKLLWMRGGPPPLSDLLPKTVKATIEAKTAARKFPPEKFLEFRKTIKRIEDDTAAWEAYEPVPECNYDQLRTPEVFLQSIWFPKHNNTVNDHARFGWPKRRPNSRTATFVLADRDDYYEAAFLTHEFVKERDYLRPDAEVAYRYVECLPPGRPVHFVFHTSFCGSTLLSRGLDEKGASLMYREPMLLHEFATMKRLGPARNFTYELNVTEISRVFGLTFGPNEIPVVKPTESCNNVARDFLVGSPGSKAILLYGTLPQFLVSILHDKSRRLYLRGHANRTRSDLDLVGLLPGINMEHATDAQLATAAWASYMAIFRSIMLDPLLADRVVSLCANTLYRDVPRTFRAAAEFFGITLSEDHIQNITSFYGKYDTKVVGRTFDVDIHRDNRKRQSGDVAAEIEEAYRWLSVIDPDRTLEAPLPRPLLSLEDDPTDTMYGDWAVRLIRATDDKDKNESKDKAREKDNSQTEPQWQTDGGAST